MTATTSTRRAPRSTRTARPTPARIPMSRIVAVELRKSFDTRSGFWLMASIGILAVIATGASILFAPDRRARPTSRSPPRSASRWR